MCIHACIMQLYAYTYRFTITSTRVDVYTVGTTRTHIKSCPSIPTHTPPVQHRTSYVHARAVAQNTVIGVLCCARTWLSRVLRTPWQMIIADWRSSVSDASNGKRNNFYFRTWMDGIGSRTILTASPWKIICGGIQQKRIQKVLRGGSVKKRSFRSWHPTGSFAVCIRSWRES